MTEHKRVKLIEIAKSLSDKRTGRSLHFSFILRNDKLLVFATNNYNKSYPTKYSTSYLTNLHSEPAVCRAYLNKYKNLDMGKLTLFNVRIGFNHEVMNAKPCKHCDDYFIKPLNWKNVFWT